MSILPRCHLPTLLLVLAIAAVVLASSGDRNPTFQHCLKGCNLTYCDPSQPPIPFYLRLFGWTCEEDCRYQCLHSFTDNIRQGSKWHQFYGKWPFYRLGPIQEPFSVLMSFGNFFVNLQGLAELKRRVHHDNKLRRWLELAGYAQLNTWVWSVVFHTRDTPLTERFDYFSATITVAFSLIYAILRVFHLQTPTTTSRLAYPAVAAVAFIVGSHFIYLLSFPLGSFPYGYHTQFVVCLGLVHFAIWILWSLSFAIRYPRFNIGSKVVAFPNPYPPNDPLKNKSIHAMTPFTLVLLTVLAMSFELLDFRPIFRIVDAHSLWHTFTIPLAVGWWSFFCQDAIEFESSIMQEKGLRPASMTAEEKMPLTGSPLLNSMESGGPQLRTPRTPTQPMFAKMASMPGPPRNRTPGRSPRAAPKAERED